MLQRLHYTAENGVTRMGHGRSRLRLRPTRAGTSFRRRALEVRLPVRREHGLSPSTPVPVPDREVQWLHYKETSWDVPSMTVFGPGAEGRPNFFASRPERAPSCPEGD